VLRRLARAKVNLGLEVVGRRPDGYHDLVTILHEVDLADELSFEEAAELTLVSEPVLGNPEDNLVLRAAKLLGEAGGSQRGATVRLTKRIPVAAGLGGGSSDAAATLRGLNDLWRLGASLSDLHALASRLGSDVPFFLTGGTCLATARGDALQPLPDPDLALVLAVLPTDLADKTRRLYAALRPEDWSDGERVGAVAERIRSGESLAGRAFPSAFTRAARELFPAVADVFSAFHAVGAVPSLCGAGPTVLSAHDSLSAARDVAARLRERGLDSTSVTSARG
jgi:4-diphosphocytidyl-2-C-methyl-D-erythritol kinase